MFFVGKSFAGYEGIIIGWGAKKQGGSSSQVLHEVYVPIMSNEDCRKTEYDEKRITANMLCAGYPDGKKDSCQVMYKNCIMQRCCIFDECDTFSDLTPVYIIIEICLSTG